MQLFNKLKQKLLPCYRVTLFYEKAFTLIEILVVATIISLLAAGGLVSYSSFVKSSRDARRKADLEQIRAALEMYRSNSTNGVYPTTLTINCNSPGAIVDRSNIYLKTIPSDPKCSKATNSPNYSYSAGPTDCDNTSTPCTSYSLSAELEDGSVYTLGPYGVETTTPTPSPTP